MHWRQSESGGKMGNIIALILSTHLWVHVNWGEASTWGSPHSLAPHLCPPNWDWLHLSLRMQSSCPTRVDMEEVDSSAGCISKEDADAEGCMWYLLSSTMICSLYCSISSGGRWYTMDAGVGACAVLEESYCIKLGVQEKASCDSQRGIPRPIHHCLSPL